MITVTILRAKTLYLRGDPLDQNQSQAPDQCDSHWISQKSTTHAHTLLKESGEWQRPGAGERGTLLALHLAKLPADSVT